MVQVCALTTRIGTIIRDVCVGAALTGRRIDREAGSPGGDAGYLPPSHYCIEKALRMVFFRPLPMGKSYDPDVTSRWRLSKANGPRSQSMHRPSWENSVSLSEVRMPLVVSMDFD